MAILTVTPRGHTMSRSSFPGLLLDLLIVFVLIVMIAIATAGAAFYVSGGDFAPVARQTAESGPQLSPSR